MFILIASYEDNNKSVPIDHTAKMTLGNSWVFIVQNRSRLIAVSIFHIIKSQAIDFLFNVYPQIEFPS